MFTNYLTVVFRQLRKYRFYTFINILGLTVGITACLVIFLFVRYELSYDRHHEHADRIIRVDWEVMFSGKHTYNAAVTPPMAEVFVRELPEVMAATRFRFMGSAQFRKNTDNIVEPKVIYADNDVFKVFTIPFVAGNPAMALKDPHSLVMSESCAARYFPGESALGKTVVKDNTTAYTVTGVFRDMPENSHFHYDVLMSMEGFPESKGGNWIGAPYNTYLLLRPNTDVAALEKKFAGIVDRYLMPYAASVLGGTFIREFGQHKENHLTLRARPLTDIHLYSHLRNELESNGDIKYVYVFTIIAVFILAIACVNFMNLATAQSARRAREVGVRKVMGSGRRSLIFQFILESCMISLFSFLLALALTDLILPAFNTLTGLHLAIPYANPSLLIGLALAALFVGFFAGVYPGVALSSFKPAEVLKGKSGSVVQSSILHNGLVIFQFTISIFLTIGTLAVFSQITYMNKADLGFNKEQIIRMRDVQNSGQALFNFKDAMLENPMIKNATVSSYFPGPESARKTPLIWPYGLSPMPQNAINAETWSVDHDYVSTLSMQIVKGRDFSRDYPSDSTAIILNESAVKRLGLGPDLIGQRLSMFTDKEDGTQDMNEIRSFTVIGVVRDFNFESLRQDVTPLVLILEKTNGSIAFRYDAEHTEAVLDALRTQWKRIAPGEPFVYGFMDADFEKTFNGEKKLGQVFVMFTALAIIIACLGLFALTAYTAEQRTKEIGIRKVLGASTRQVVLLLSSSFARLILISFIVAVPIAAQFIRWYLGQYAYKADIGLWVYAGAGLFAFIIAMATIGVQCIKSANANPVDSLKHE